VISAGSKPFVVSFTNSASGCWPTATCGAGSVDAAGPGNADVVGPVTPKSADALDVHQRLFAIAVAEITASKTPIVISKNVVLGREVFGCVFFMRHSPESLADKTKIDIQPDLGEIK
jgi:hypothetical protein